MTKELKLTGEQVEALFKQHLGGNNGLHVEEVRAGYARLRMPFHKWMLRPGHVISGPALFTAADAAMYTLVLAHLGPVVMAVTSNMSLHFLAAAPAGDVIAECKLLRMGKRLAVMEVSLFTGPDRTFAAHVTGTYALPRGVDSAA
jgi:uncharacterized protein (TIGR00369 family)